MNERETRLKRLADLVALGIDPYPTAVGRSHSIAEYLEQFDEQLSAQTPATIAGRAIAIRSIGALTFVRLDDGTAEMQAVLRKDDLGESYDTILGHADLGDFFAFTGNAFVTKRGERSLLVSSARFLAKALRPLPEKWHGLQDVELRYRHRELDLVSNPEIRQLFVKRSRLVSALRQTLDAQGFLEVETPMLQPIPGGANAKPFVTHHNALGADLFLRIAPELYLKRLIVGGLPKIYEIGRCFRNEGIDHAHNPEFTMLELYFAFVDKEEFVKFLEELLMTAIKASAGSLSLAGGSVVNGEVTLNFVAPWPRQTFREAVQTHCGIDVDTLQTPDAVVQAAKEHDLKIDFSKAVGLGEHLDELWKKAARPKIIQPTWILDYPSELKPLAKPLPADRTKSATIQLVVLGAEIVNAYYHELNDPLEQRARFAAQETLRSAGSEEAQRLDEDFLTALEHGMPPTSGVGIGIDRLVALVTGVHNLKEAILFPTLKPKI